MRGTPTKAHRPPAYPILEAKIAEHGIKKKDIAKVLRITARALSSKFTRKVSFSLDEALTIKQTFFPDISVEELFDKCDDIVILNHKVNNSKKRCELIAAAKKIFDEDFD